MPSPSSFRSLGTEMPTCLKGAKKQDYFIGWSLPRLIYHDVVKARVESLGHLTKRKWLILRKPSLPLKDSIGSPARNTREWLETQQRDLPPYLLGFHQHLEKHGETPGREENLLLPAALPVTGGVLQIPAMLFADFLHYHLKGNEQTRSPRPGCMGTRSKKGSFT